MGHLSKFCFGSLIGGGFLLLFSFTVFMTYQWVEQVYSIEYSTFELFWNQRGLAILLAWLALAWAGCLLRGCWKTIAWTYT